MANSYAAGFAAAVIVVGTLAASAATYNAVSGSSAGHTGGWSYFGQLNNGAPVPLAGESCGGASGVTCVGNGQASPNHIGVIVNAGSAPVSVGGTQVAADSLSLDPGSGAAIARWTAAAAGTYDITGSFTDDATQDASPGIEVLDSQSTVPLMPATLLSGSPSFSFDNVQFAVGDFVDFVVSAADPTQNLSVGLDPTVSGIGGTPVVLALEGDPPADVPEPGSLALLATAALGLGLARRRLRL